ncbi:hypothetical protein J6590_059465 [Homalodisca vitripennis]|nr:hypothetical protein J6590_059465 [Homalodisca vitripennis]
MNQDTGFKKLRTISTPSLKSCASTLMLLSSRHTVALAGETSPGMGCISAGRGVVRLGRGGCLTPYLWFYSLRLLSLPLVNVTRHPGGAETVVFALMGGTSCCCDCDRCVKCEHGHAFPIGKVAGRGSDGPVLQIAHLNMISLNKRFEEMTSV